MLQSKTCVRKSCSNAEKCKCKWRDSKLCFFSPNKLFQLCYTHVLKEVMEILHLYIKIKSKVGVNFDVPHDVPLRGI